MTFLDILFQWFSFCSLIWMSLDSSAQNAWETALWWAAGEKNERRCRLTSGRGTQGGGGNFYQRFPFQSFISSWFRLWNFPVLEHCSDFWNLSSVSRPFRVLNRASRCFDSDSLNSKHFKKVFLFHFYLVWKLGLQKFSAQFWQTFYRMVWKKISRNPCKNQAVRHRTAIFQFILTPNKGTRNCKNKLPY